jgi:hypothetical protein
MRQAKAVHDKTAMDPSVTTDEAFCDFGDSV